jgi:hypothetical protein
VNFLSDINICSLSLVSKIEELRGRKYSGSGLGKPRLRPQGSATLTTRHLLYPQKLALTSPTSSGQSIGIVRSQIKATELILLVFTEICS